TASGGTAPYTFRIIDGALPSGLSLASDGTVSGTPSKEESSVVTIQATDAFGCSGALTYTFEACAVIFLLPSATPPAPPVTFVLPQATVGEPYKQTFSTNCGPSSLCVLTGTRPPGLDPAGCVLAGTPTIPGIFDFTVTAGSASQAYRIVVVCPPTPPLLPPTLPDGT